MTYKEYFGDWFKIIPFKELNKVMNTLNTLYNTKSICPNKENIFKAFTLCTLKDLKIVFIGQDPYPQKGVATGILFGNKEETKMSPSLQIIKESCIDFEVPHNNIIFDPTLESWARQGILMINSAFTVEENKIGSHTLLWRPFIIQLLRNLSNINTGIIYVLFGKEAQSFIQFIGKNNHILKINHPAYYARTNTKMPHQLFLDINNLVKNIYNEEIKWYEEY